MEGFNEFRESVKARMTEMSAVVDAFGKKADELQSEAREEMRKAVQEMQAHQKVLQDYTERLRQYESEAWEKGAKEVEKAWSEFEKLASYAAGRFDSEREAYTARAEAQLKNWWSVVDQYSERVAQVADEERERFRNLIDDLRHKQKNAEGWFHQVGASNADGWKTVAKGFEDAWQQFDSAAKTAAGEFEKMFKGQGDNKK